MISMPISDVVRRIAVGSAASLLLTFLAFRAGFNLSSATSAHLFLVAAIALRWGFLEASIVSLLSVACLDFFFTHPLFVFTVSDMHDWVALGTFEAAALFISTLSNQVRRHARESEMRQVQLQRLYELSEHILLLDWSQEVEQQLVDLIRVSLRVRGVALWNASSLHMGKAGECDIADDEVHAAYYMNANKDESNLEMSLRVLRMGARPFGALCLCGHSLDAATVNATASLVAITIERARSFSAESNAEAAKKSEQLRSAILDGLAHDFKSPLTAILASSSGLLAMNTLAGTEKRLVSLINRQAGHISDLAIHLLRTAKLDTDDLKISREEVDLAQLIQDSIETSSYELDGRAIEIRFSAQLNSVQADRKLLQMALVQLLDNAVKYGSPGSSIAIEVREERTELLITVRNQGSFIPIDEREKIFQRFYRYSGSARTTSGTGIGLSVVRRITEAHHGRAWVNSDPVDGTAFVITLPRITSEA
jgi:two-component system sensor histidine kinase KdpD